MVLSLHKSDFMNALTLPASRERTSFCFVCTRPTVSRSAAAEDPGAIPL